MVGLTRFLCLMNLCEKSGVSINIHAGFRLLQKHAEIRAAKKPFVLQETTPSIENGRRRGDESLTNPLETENI
jgi:hypothetical protein